MRFFILILVLFYISCNKDDAANPVTIPAQTLMNVSYGSDSRQQMDVYLPAARNTDSTKVLIMIHGGGWTTGDKSDFKAFVDTMKARLPKYAVFNINYRLSANSLNVFPAQENDVKAAVEFIHSKASEYLISGKYVLIGASAGGHLSMLQGYKYNSPVKVKAVVSFFGPSDLTDMYNNPAGGNPLLSLALANAVGKTPSQDPALYFNSSPLNFITAGSPPTILLHGGADPLVSSSQSVAVKNKLQNLGVINQYVYYPTGGHGDWDAGTYKNAFNTIQAFLAANVN
jgi:acetyl esterase/lipase